MEKSKEMLDLVEKKYKFYQKILYWSFIIILISTSLFVGINFYPSDLEFILALVFSGVILVIPWSYIDYYLGIKPKRLRLEYNTLVKSYNSEVIEKVRNHYDSEFISLSKSKARQLSVGDSIVFFDETISVFKSWDSFLRLVNNVSLNNSKKIDFEDLISNTLNYKIQIKVTEIVGIRIINIYSILNSEDSLNNFISDSSTSDEILEITYFNSDQLQRVYLEMNYLKTFQSILKDKIILEPSNQYEDGFQGIVNENEFNQLKEIIANEKQSTDVVLQNTQTYESYVHIIFLAVAILFPFDVLRLLASFAGVVLSWFIIADEKKKSTEKIVSSILIVVYILYALVVINYYF